MHQFKMSKYIPPSKRVVEQPTTDVTSTAHFPSLSVFSSSGSVHRTSMDFKKAIEETNNTIVEVSNEKPVIASHPLAKMRVFEMTNQEYLAAKNNMVETFIDTPKVYYNYNLPNFVEDDDEDQEYHVDVSNEYCADAFEASWDTYEDVEKDNIQEEQEIAYENYLQEQ